MGKKIRKKPFSKTNRFLDRDMLNLILSRMPEGVVIENENYEIEFMNEPLTRLFGDQVGKKCYEVFIGRDAPCEICSIDQIIRKKKKLFTYTAEDRIGRVYELVACPYEKPDGSLSVLEIVRDVTDKKKVDQELRETKDYLSNILSNSQIAIAVMDNQGSITLFNRGAEKLTGYKAEEVIGKKNVLEFCPHKKDTNSFREEIFEQGVIENSDSVLLKKDKSEVPISISASVLKDSSGKPIGSIVITTDRTERKKAEDEIKYLKDFNQEIVEELPIGVVRLDQKGIVVYMNPQLNEMLGVKEGSKSKAIGWKVTEIPNIVQTGAVKTLKKLLSGRPFKNLVTPYISLEGKKIILSAHGVPLFDKSGKINGALLFVEDISEQKKAEAELLRRNRELLALNTISKVTTQSLDLEECLKNTLDRVLEIMEGDYGGVYVFDDRKLELNLAVKKNLHLSSIKKKLESGEGICGEIARTGNPRLIPEMEKDSQNPALEIKGKKLRSFMGVPIKSKNEVLGVLFVAFKKTKDFGPKELDLLTNIGNQIGIAAENVRLYRESENWISQLDTIRKITNRLNKINNVMTIAYSIAEEIKKVIEFDNCRVFLLDESGQNLIPVAFGSKVEEYKGETEELLKMKMGEGITGWIAEIGIGKIIDDVERHPKVRHIPGTPFIDESMMAVPMIYEGKVRGVITLSKLGLKQFNRSHLGLLNILANEAIVAVENARLFEDLKRAYSKLKAAQDQLIQSEKLNALGEMAGGVAHDFNNVLGAILGRAQLLQLSVSDPKIKKGISLMEQAAMDGAETVRRIQEFTRVRTDEAFVEVNVNEMVKQSIEMTRHKWKDQAQEKGIVVEIKTNLGKPDAIVAGNPSELRETFTNIILNALDAMPQGGEIHISTKKKGNSAELSFSDSGKGMSEKVKRKAFDPFFTTKGPKGTGLGLSVAYGIIIRHGGKIYLESKESKGTTFFIQIPIRKVLPSAPSKEAFSLPPQKSKILIIDDEPAIIDLLKEILELHHQEVKTALGGKEGIAKFEKGGFDIVFTDLSMPEMSGWEVVRVLKELNPHAIMVMITGWGTQFDSQRLKEEGVDLIVAKPFEVKKVIETVSRAFELKKERIKEKPLSHA